MKSFSLPPFVLAAAALAFTVSTAFAAEPAKPSAPAAPHWSYDGATSPSHWGALKSGNPECAKGMSQSPIDIDIKSSDMGKIEDPYRFQYRDSRVKVVNNGHAIQANLESKSDKLDYQHDVYVLQQFHFHSPSEHTVDGQHFPMEMHLVHADAKGHLTVVGVFIKEGAENKTLAKMFARLPKGEKAKAEVMNVQVEKLLPASHHAYVYTGSLTTPPCSEHVNWIVMRDPLTMSKNQIAAFEKLYDHNDRPTQPLNGRKVELE
jgi:carbonic anhydrase